MRKTHFSFWWFIVAPVALGILVVALSRISFAPKYAQQNISTSLASPIASPSSTFGSSSARSVTNLEKYLTVEAALLGIVDNVSIYFKDEGSEQEIGINPVKSWIPASTIKAFVAVEAFRQRTIGLIDFNQTVAIQAPNVVPTELETDDFPRLREGTQATIRQLVEAMVIQSDNTAYNTLLDILDRRAINATLKNLGITQTVVGEKLNLDDNQFAADLQVPGRQPNTITAKDLSTLFDLLYSNKISSSDEILAIFKRQKINTMIPALLPPSTVVAHKTGDWAPIYHDGGIVYKPDDPFIVSIFTNSNNPSIVAQLARVAYYRSAQVVGQNVTIPTTKLQAENSTERIYLAETPESNVLGETTDLQSGERRYTIAPGDTLWSIAQAQYNSGYLYSAIIERNAITDPGNLSAGTTIILPALAGMVPPPESQGPTINAADLGVTESDLQVGKAQTNTVGAAFILPGSPLYVVKSWLQQQAVGSAQTNDSKIDALLGMSRAKLGEVKRELSFGNVTAAQTLLGDSEQALHQATDLAKASSNNEVALYKIKQQRDVHFGVLHDAATQMSTDKKEAYVDAVYAFYQKQKQDIQPTIASVKVENPLQQKPIIGTVSEIKNNVATVKTDDGKSTQIVVTVLTPSKTFDQVAVTPGTSVQPGEKIAVVGKVTPQGIVTPQFILRDVPKNLPVGHSGRVVEIDPKEHTLKLQDTMGKIDTIIIGDQTTIKSKDTDVSLIGIKAGSTISVVGTVIKSSPTPSTTIKATGGPTPAAQPIITPSGNSSSTITGKPEAGKASPAENPEKGPSAAPRGPVITIPTIAPSTSPNKGVLGKGGKPATTAPATPGQTVQATTVVVVNNSSGKNEKVTNAPASKTPEKHENKPENKPASAPPPAAPETKKPEQKKK